MSFAPPSPSIFESFNARALTAEGVAKTFIPSEKFDTLAQRCHSIVVGPRGSGKTSLLKMLQGPALEAWRHSDAASFRRKIDYSSIFIGTDSAWSEQLRTLGLHTLDDAVRRQCALAAFTYHVLHCLFDGFLNRFESKQASSGPSHRRIKVEPDVETALVREIAKTSDLEPATDSIVSLKHAAKAKISEVWSVALSLQHVSHEKQKERVADISFLNKAFLYLVSHALEVFNDAVDEPKARWALLFDELELAPEFILQELLRALRSFDECILIKLSLSPYSSSIEDFREHFSATAGQDYNEVRLWYSHKEQGYTFGRNLVTAVLREEGVKIESLEEVFGYSPFEERQGQAYKRGSVQYSAFEEALRTDASVRSYFEKNGLSLEKLQQLSQTEKAPTVRKIFPTVLVRTFFRTREQQKHTRERSRKNPSIYGGTTGLLAMSEGNPRWLIGIARELLPMIRVRRKVPPSVQTAEILKIVHRFRALLKLIPASETNGSMRPRSVLDLLDGVGEFFHWSVVLSDFNPQPYGSFVVDSHTTNDIERALGLAVNAGAIVYVPDEKGETLVGSVRGKRFRLAYLLSPYYKLPIRLGEAASLSRILNKDTTEIGEALLSWPKSQ